MILLIDNYDSFAHNLARYFVRLGCTVKVVRNDEWSVGEIADFCPEAIILSPGPCTPNEAGVSLRVVSEFHEAIPILGVCLGHQTIAAAFGGRIIRAPEPMHGRVSEVLHDGSDLFTGLANPLLACRYHSLVVDPNNVPKCLRVTARTRDGVVMALRHRALPVFGVQFHPESILTRQGQELLANFLRFAGIDVEPRNESAQELRETVPADFPWPEEPVTF